MHIKYELWETGTGPILFPSSNSTARKALKQESSRVCLMVFTAQSWEEACEKVNEILQLGPYSKDNLIEQEFENVRAKKFSNQAEVLNFAGLSD